MKQALYLALLLSAALAQDTNAQVTQAPSIDSAKLHWPEFLDKRDTTRSDTTVGQVAFFFGAPWVDFDPAHWDHATVEYYRGVEHRMLSMYQDNFDAAFHNDSLRAANLEDYVQEFDDNAEELLAARYMVIWLDYYGDNPTIDPKIVVPGVAEQLSGKRFSAPILTSQSVHRN